MLRGITKICVAFKVQAKQSTRSNELINAIKRLNFSRLKLHLYQHPSSDSPLMKLLSLKQHCVDNIDTFEQIKTFNPHDLALSLNFIGITQRTIKSQMITQLLYTELLEKYFSKIESFREGEPTLVNKFIYLENPSVRDFIKKSQINLLQKKSLYQPIPAYLFEQIISSDLFNITDLPTIYQHLYQQYFPSLFNLNTLKDLHRSLIYLTEFSKWPIFLPKKIFEILEKQLSNSQDLTFTTFIQMADILYLMMFRFTKIIDQMKLKSRTQRLFKRLIEKNISFDPGFENFAPLVYQENNSDPQIFFLNFKCLTLNEIIRSFQKRKQFLENQKKTLAQALKLKINSPNENQLCLNLILGEQIKRIQKLMQKKSHQLLQKTYAEYKIKQSRVFFTAAIMPFLKSEIFFHYISEEKNYRFFSKNACIPHLQKSFNIIEKQIKKEGKTSEQFSKLCKSIKNRLDKFITNDNLNTFAEELIIKEDIISKNSTISYQENFQRLLWAEEGISKFVSFESKYQINKMNALWMIKNEPEYMLNLMRWDSKFFLSKFFIQKELKPFGFHIQPCKYTEGIGFKVTEEGKRKSTYLKFRHDLILSSSQSGEQSTQYLKGNLKMMIKSLRRLKKTL